MSTKKICVLGDFAVGKTSTVGRVVHNVFSEKYLTTVGVKIDTFVYKPDVGAVGPDSVKPMKLVIWDIAGTDRFTAVEFSYLRGASGYLLVVDGTRPDTAGVARGLLKEASTRYGELPFVTLVNKIDLTDEWALSEDEIDALRRDGHTIFMTSAKTGEGVMDALGTLCQSIG
ncbi:MAG: Rab family GTPase [Pseudomonadota bacterium]